MCRNCKVIKREGVVRVILAILNTNNVKVNLRIFLAKNPLSSYTAQLIHLIYCLSILKRAFQDQYINKLK